MNKTVITVFNKCDKASEEILIRDFQADAKVIVSAKTGEGLTDCKRFWRLGQRAKNGN